MAQIMAHDGPFIVATIDYRLAPENKFPVPLNDCMDGLDWLVEQVHKYGGDASKLVVAGDSCGGNLTLAVAKENVKKGDDAIDISGLVCGSMSLCFYRTSVVGRELTGWAVRV